MDDAEFTAKLEELLAAAQSNKKQLSLAVMQVLRLILETGDHYSEFHAAKTLAAFNMWNKNRTVEVPDEQST